MPLIFSGCTSLSQSGGKGGSAVATAFGAPGVARTLAEVADICRFMPGKVRMFTPTELVFARHQYESVYVAFVTIRPVIRCCSELLTLVPPGNVPFRNKLRWPEWLTLLTIAEFR